MMWSFNTFVSFFGILIYGILFLVVAFSKPQTTSRRSFRAYLLCMLVWSISSLFIFLDLAQTAFWFRWMIAAAIGSMLSLFHFIQTTLERRFAWAFWVYLAGIAGSLLALSTSWVVSQVTVVNGQIDYTFSPLIILFAAPGYLLTLFSLVLLYQGYRTSENLLQRNRLRYLMLGLMAVILGSLFNWTPLGRYPVDIAANGLTALLISYAVLRHHLLDISVVVRKGLLYSIPTTIIGAAYFLVITLALRIFHASSTGEILLVSLIIAILAALVAQPVRDRAQSWIDRLFFREKYDSTLMLQRISRTAASVLDLTRLTQMILDEIATHLHIPRAAFLLKREESGEFHLLAQQGAELPPALKLSNRHPLVLSFAQRDLPLSHHDLGVQPHFKALWGQERADLERIGAELFIPLKSKGELVGILAVGPKLSEQEFSPDDQLTLTTLANQTAVAIQNARLFSAEREQRKLAEDLREVGTELTGSLEFESVLDHLLDQIARIVPYDIGEVFLVEGKSFQVARSSRSTREPDAVDHLGTTDLTQSSDPSRIRDLIHNGMPLIRSLNLSESEKPFVAPSWLGIPVISEGQVIACFSLEKFEPEYYTTHHIARLSIFAGQVALALKNLQLFNKLQQMAIVDEVTGIYNRRHLFELAEREFKRAVRFNGTISTIMIDLDHFRRINNTYGHVVGDQILRAAGERFQANIREVDILGRYGGDEFTIVLLETGVTEALRIIERLRENISAVPIITNSGPLTITASFGISTLTEDVPTLEQLLDRADHAMYLAKKNGRNSVCVFQDQSYEIKKRSDQTSKV